MDITKIKHLLGFKPDHFKESGQVIEYAFTVGGTWTGLISD